MTHHRESALLPTDRIQSTLSRGFAPGVEMLEAQRAERFGFTPEEAERGLEQVRAVARALPEHPYSLSARILAQGAACTEPGAVFDIEGLLRYVRVQTSADGTETRREVSAWVVNVLIPGLPGARLIVTPLPDPSASGPAPVRAPEAERVRSAASACVHLVHGDDLPGQGRALQQPNQPARFTALRGLVQEFCLTPRRATSLWGGDVSLLQAYAQLWGPWGFGDFTQPLAEGFFDDPAVLERFVPAAREVFGCVRSAFWQPARLLAPRYLGVVTGPQEQDYELFVGRHPEGHLEFAAVRGTRTWALDPRVNIWFPGTVFAPVMAQIEAVVAALHEAEPDLPFD